jgi:plastocyanin
MGNATSSRAAMTLVAAAIVVAIGGAITVASGAASGPVATVAATKNVKVADHFYAPKRIEVAAGTRIKWVWSSRSSGRHDIYVHKRPDGAGRFRSPPATAPFSFARKLRKPGVYKILCTIHEGMRMRIDVTRREAG